VVPFRRTVKSRHGALRQKRGVITFNISPQLRLLLA